MRLEKLNDNQIRCTLDRDDLVTRGLRLSELAYGTEKAKELFRDMMQQASYEFGFDAEDLPLMIEAIPTSLDRLVLVITKVEDPDELDTRFSKFSPDPSDMDYEDDEDLEEDFLRCLGQPDSYMTTSDADTSSEPPEFIPLPDCLGIQPQKKAEPEKQKVSADAMKVYSFSSCLRSEKPLPIWPVSITVRIWSTRMPIPGNIFSSFSVPDILRRNL